MTLFSSNAIKFGKCLYFKMIDKFQVMSVSKMYICFIYLFIEFFFCVLVTILTSGDPVFLSCYCLVKVASSGGGLVVTSGSLIKWIWFLRGNSRLLSPGARPTLVSIWLTCVCCWKGGGVRVCVCLWERKCPHVQHTVFLSRYDMCVCACLRFSVLSKGEAVCSNGKQQPVHHVH